ncbi:hypothetical protein F5B19DRAFT_169184 [Rostrohypoxylon terebratum]|nr:hypothetical protein F5B19DRAFT_169184 [Rostrohypoxylon terebratum]
MENPPNRRASATRSSTSSVYSTQTLPAPVPPVETARGSQASFASRTWIFSKVRDYNTAPSSPINPNPNPNSFPNNTLVPQSRRRPSRQSYTRSSAHLEAVAIRDSVGYPSASSFEATIEKGTARFGRRAPTKPRIVDLSGLRKRVKRMTMLRRGSENRSVSGLGSGATPATLREAFGEARVIVEPSIDIGRERELEQERDGEREVVQIQLPPAAHTRPDMKNEEHEHKPESPRFSPQTNHQLATLMYHQTHNDIIRRSKTEPLAVRAPELPFRDKIRGKHFSKTTGNLGEEVASYDKGKRRGCTTAQCIVI